MSADQGQSLVQRSRFAGIGIGSEQRWKMPVRAVQSRAVEGKSAGLGHVARCAVAFAETVAARAAAAEEKVVRAAASVEETAAVVDARQGATCWRSDAASQSWRAGGTAQRIAC